MSTEPQPASVSMPPEATKDSSIHDTPPPNPLPQVQQDVPASAHSVTSPPIDQPPKELAEIKPEPLEGTQNTIPADSKIQEPPKPSSFGDLMGNITPDLSAEPTIHIDPIEAPTPAPVTDNTPIVPHPSELPADNRQAELVAGRQQALAVRKRKREEHLVKILELAQQNGKVNNLDVRDHLHISQTTATDYLRTLVNSGKLKREGKAKATKYYL